MRKKNSDNSFSKKKLPSLQNIRDYAGKTVITGRKKVLSMLLRPGHYEQELQNTIDNWINERLLELITNLPFVQNDVIEYNSWIKDIINKNSSELNETLAKDIEKLLQKRDKESLALFLLKYYKNDANTKELLKHYLNKLHEDIESAKINNTTDWKNLKKIDEKIQKITTLLENKIDNSSKDTWDTIRKNIETYQDNCDFGFILKALSSKELSSITNKLSKEDRQKLQQLKEQFKIELISQPLEKLKDRGHFDIYLIPIAAIMVNYQTDKATKQIVLTSAINDTLPASKSKRPRKF